MMKRYTRQLVEIRRSHAVEEIAKPFSAHTNTAREWIKRGLPTCCDMRPAPLWR
jgi:hypothetical protein